MKWVVSYSSFALIVWSLVTKINKGESDDSYKAVVTHFAFPEQFANEELFVSFRDISKGASNSSQQKPNQGSNLFA